MYALIRQYDGLEAGISATATEKASAGLRPLLAKTPGFVSYEVFRPDGTNDAVTSISVFETRAAADASHEVAAEWVRTNLPTMTKAPRKLAGELATH